MIAITDVEQTAAQVGRDVAASFADEVDREARFPVETVSALRETGLLSSMVPEELGGGGASLPEIAGAVKALAFHCASSALVFAMHQIEVAYLARHGTTPALQGLLREVVSHQLLLANANSEVGVGGDVGQSICAVERIGSKFRLVKDTLAISYGAYADATLATARASSDAAANDQVLLACRAPNMTFEKLTEWNTLGLRGTCSNGYHIEVEDDEGMIFPEPFSEITARTGSPVTQVLLASVWWGLAEAAAAKAHDYCARAQARRNVGSRHPSALRFAELFTALAVLRTLIADTARRYEEAKDTSEIEDWGFSIQLRNLKIQSSVIAVDIATKALGICGLAGYQLDSPFSLGRIVRDLHGGPIMVNNDRLQEMNAQVLLVIKET